MPPLNKQIKAGRGKLTAKLSECFWESSGGPICVGGIGFQFDARSFCEVIFHRDCAGRAQRHRKILGSRIFSGPGKVFMGLREWIGGRAPSTDAPKPQSQLNNKRPKVDREAAAERARKNSPWRFDDGPARRPVGRS
jgi:hypothetical protein